MEDSVALLIAQRIPYWYRPQEEHGLESLVKGKVSELLGRFVDPNESVFLYGHDISEAVMKSHPLIEAYSRNDSNEAGRKLSSMLFNSFTSNDTHLSESYRHMQGVFKKYGSKIGMLEPVFFGDVQNSEQALLRVWYETISEMQKYESAHDRKRRVLEGKKHDTESSMERLRAMKSAIRHHFPDSSSFFSFLKDTLFRSELVPYIANCLEPNPSRQSSISPMLLPYYMIIGYETLKGTTDHGIFSMKNQIRREVYIDR